MDTLINGQTENKDEVMTLRPNLNRNRYMP